MDVQEVCTWIASTVKYAKLERGWGLLLPIEGKKQESGLQYKKNINVVGKFEIIVLFRGAWTSTGLCSSRNFKVRTDILSIARLHALLQTD